ncbi:hypothetical protein PR202_ga10138 [Eleusine coracana subsp. coracana]|uniref:DNA-directed RNA polymerase III subunit RPC3 n=1 Tax=Eleusine coracana subsp. coracana TaxID=191504 RepID=A0AAV5C605_ELECO|nr:hypothetical protein PR202_ga10138 [Eleusine coracana subsp. coracana]
MAQQLVAAAREARAAGASRMSDGEQDGDGHPRAAESILAVPNGANLLAKPRPPLSYSVTEAAGRIPALRPPKSSQRDANWIGNARIWLTSSDSLPPLINPGPRYAGYRRKTSLHLRPVHHRDSPPKPQEPPSRRRRATMVSQHGILLAASIISDHFGALVSVSSSPLLLLPFFLAAGAECHALTSDHPIPLSQKVLSCLLRRGPLSLQEIIRRVELSPGQVKNALLVLIQHNWAADKTVTLYLAIFDNVLHRLRFTKFLSVIREDIPESEALIEGLLLNGRLTFDQLMERTISKISEGMSIY